MPGESMGLGGGGHGVLETGLSRGCGEGRYGRGSGYCTYSFCGVYSPPSSVFTDNHSVQVLGPIYALLANIKMTAASKAPKVILSDARVYCSWIFRRVYEFNREQGRIS
jgi:hypothetical protein